MKYNHIIETFPSKKNHVFLIDRDSQQVVVKEFSCIENMKHEASIHYKIGIKLPTPTILSMHDNCIEYEYIRGQTLLQLLETCALTSSIIRDLIHWIKEFYSLTGMILGDAHLRNFIYSNGIYGVDFETAKKGLPEEDLATLILFTLTYYPMFTEDKIVVAKTIARVGIEELELDKDMLYRELISGKIQLEERRKKVLLHPAEWEALFLKVL